MKWNQKNKDKLYQAIKEKFLDIKSQGLSPPISKQAVQSNLVRSFLHEFGIKRVVLQGGTWLDTRTRKPAVIKDGIIIVDPWRERIIAERLEGLPGLSIPKETAIKFLVLGIP